MEIQEICIKMDARKWRALKPVSPICRVFPAILLFLFALCVPTLNAQADSDKDIQKQLEAKFRKSTLTIRHFYSGNSLKYDSEGLLVKGGKPGPWTLNAYFEPEKIRLSKKFVTLSGKRIWWSYNDSKKSPTVYRVSENTKIEISRSSEQNDLAGILASLQTVFLKGDESLADFVPSYWRKFIQSDFNEEQIKQNSLSACCSKLSASNHTDPVAQHLPRPEYTEEARRAGVKGWSLLCITVDETGNAKVTEIIKPLGLGLDDSAVKTIEESWKFTPAMRDGVPFEMNDVRIEVSFDIY